MSIEAKIVATKIRIMNEQIKFLEYAFSLSDKDKAINSYTGKVPDKYITGD